MSRIEGMRCRALLTALRLAAIALAIGLAPTAAQADPMEEQRCVWRCLSGSRGASDPAYDACVRAQCTRPAARSRISPAPSPPARPSGAAPPPPGGKDAAPPAYPRHAAPPRGQAWRTVSDLSYPAVAQCLPVEGGANLCLVVGCPRHGGLSLELYGLENGLAGAPVRLSTTGALFDLTLPPRAPEEDAYRWPMPLGLAATLKAESGVTLEVAGRGFRLPLTGSGAAIGGVEARCR